MAEVGFERKSRAILMPMFSYRRWFPTHLNQDIRYIKHRLTIQGLKKRRQL
jgi:hypothetical protein